MDEDTANASVDPPELVTNSVRFSVLFVCCFDCSYNVLSFPFFFLFISSNCSFNVQVNIEASSSRSMT